jgi:hypothetical protein
VSFFVEVESASLIKTGEELCGDSVAIIRAEDSFIAVLSDGLGSGVKASILSTLTGKIASTMLEKGSSLEDVVYTLVQTLPVCKVRGLAYATFTVVQIFKDGQIYVAESDNPELLFFRDGINRKIPRKETVIENKLIYESSFQLVEGDTLVIISDGVINAGIGGIRPLGWPLEEIASEIEEIFLQKRSNVKAKEIAIHIKDRCQEFYRSQIGDDTTALVLKVRHPRELTVAVGPPKDKVRDREYVEDLMKKEGMKVVCGGTTSTLVARELQRELTVNLDLDSNLPPTGSIEGIDLVTEGIVTICRALDLIKEVEGNAVLIRGKDGASELSKVLLRSDRISFQVGQAINPAHQNPNLPHHLALKNQVVKELSAYLETLGKEIEISFY